MSGGNRRVGYQNEYQTRREFVGRYWGQRNGYGRRYGNANRQQQ